MKLNKKLIAGIGGGALALAVVALVAGAGAGKKEAAKHEAARKMAHQTSERPVRCEKVEARPLERTRSYPGTVKASEESALSFRVGGPLVDVNVTLGEPVKKGDLLMQIDPRDFEDQIVTLEAQLAGAEAIRDNAKQDYKRVSDLFEDKVVPQSDYDRAKSAIDSAEAQVKTVSAQLQVARHALDDTSLRAPYDGTVTKQNVENYEMIKPGKVVMQYHNIQTLEIVVRIPENEVANSPINTQGIGVDVSFPSLNGQVFEAGLKEWSTMADPLTRTYQATFEMEAPKEVRILPGMTAKVDFSKNGDIVRAITVPVSALVSDPDGGSGVWIYNKAEGKASMRHVEVGALNGSDRVVITDGLVEGDLVVVTGSRLIHGNLPLETASAD